MKCTYLKTGGLIPVFVLTVFLESVANAQDADEQVFELSAFEVAVDEDRGYFSPNSVVATGFSQEIYKTPLNISALTEEFLTDVGSQSINDAIGYIGGVQMEQNLSQPQSRYRMRGFRTEYTSRNGILHYGGLGSENIDRVEVVKGPASVFFGQVSPGGVVNFTTKRPSFTKKTELGVTIGSYDHKYVNFGTQGPLWKDALAYRVYASYLDKEDWRDFEFEERSFIYGGLQYRVSPRLKFFLEYEETKADYMYAYSMPRGNRIWVETLKDLPAEMIATAITDPRYDPNRFQPVEFAQILYNSNFPRFAEDYQATFGIDVGSQISDAVPEATPRGRKFNQSGPGGWREYDGSVLTAEMNWNPFDWLYLRAINVDAYTFRPAFLGAQYTELATADGSIRTTVPTQQMQENSSRHSALEAVLEFDALRGRHRILLGASYFDDQFRNNRFQNAPTSPDWFDTLWNIGEQGYWNIREFILFDEGHRPAGFGVDNFTRAYYTSYVGRYFDEKLILMAGIRDETFVRRQVQNFERVEGEEGRNRYDEKTPMFGLVYEFKEGFSAFASYSLGYLPGTGALVQGPGRTPEELVMFGDNKEGEGIEFGFKARTTDNRLSGTVSFFQISFTNNIRTQDFERSNADPRNQNDDPFDNVVFFTIGGDSQSQGLDFDFVYTPIPEVQLVANYVWMWQAEVLENQAQPEQEGSRFNNAPEHSASLWVKYSFLETKLEGFSVGLGLKYNDWVWQKVQPDRSTIISPSYTVFDALLEYKTEIKGIPTRFALNVTNVFDKEYIASASGTQSSAVPGDVRNFMFSVDLKF